MSVETEQLSRAQRLQELGLATVLSEDKLCKQHLLECIKVAAPPAPRAVDSGDAEDETSQFESTIEIKDDMTWLDAETLRERTAGFKITCTSPVLWNQEACVTLTADAPATGWDWDITSITGQFGAITPFAPGSSAGTPVTVCFLLDIDYSIAGKVNPITVSASWSIPSSRRLRALQDGEQQSGEIQETFNVEFDTSSVPPELLGTDSAASGMTLSFSTTMMAAAGGLAALAI
ncbi:MAG: hypothetical protein SGILL_005877 [Bacillariaceae sp.]